MIPLKIQNPLPTYRVVAVSAGGTLKEWDTVDTLLYIVTIFLNEAYLSEGAKN